MGIPHIIDSKDNINARIGSDLITVPADHRFYDKIVEALHAGDADRFSELAQIGKGIVRYLSKDNDGNDLVKIVESELFYKNQPIHNVVTEKILRFMEKGLPFEPTIRFLERLLLNPSRHSIKQLYLFLENHKLPITDDGCFIAYKRVRDDWYDFHSGTVLNTVGTQVTPIERRDVDDDYSNECGLGYHVGAIDYVRGFYGSQGHVVAVKVDPANAVSVPENEATKMRVTTYFVMEEIPDPEAKDSGLTGDLYNTEGTSYTEVVPDCSSSCGCAEEDDDYEDDDYEDDEEDDDDEDEEDDDITTLVKDWAVSVGVPLTFLSDEKVSNAIENQDTVSTVQHLYRQALQINNASLISTLENPIYTNRLRDIFCD